MNEGPYYGDVEVIVRMRYRVSAPLPLSSANGQPTVEGVLSALKQSRNNILDDEDLEVLGVVKIGENCNTGDY